MPEQNKADELPVPAAGGDTQEDKIAASEPPTRDRIDKIRELVDLEASDEKRYDPKLFLSFARSRTLILLSAIHAAGWTMQSASRTRRLSISTAA